MRYEIYRAKENTMKKLLTDLLKYETGFLVFYGILLAANIIKKDVFSSPVYWLALVLGNVAFLTVMVCVYLYRSRRSKKK